MQKNFIHQVTADSKLGGDVYEKGKKQENKQALKNYVQVITGIISMQVYIFINFLFSSEEFHLKWTIIDENEFLNYDQLQFTKKRNTPTHFAYMSRDTEYVPGG